MWEWCRAVPDEVSSFELNALIAYRDTDDSKDDDSRRFHLNKVTNIADGQTNVHCYVTRGKALSRVHFTRPRTGRSDWVTQGTTNQS